MDQEKINQCQNKVKKIYEQFDASHDWQHIERVMKNAKMILAHENADVFIVELAVLLHDVSDPKYKKPNEDLEREILEGLDLTNKQRQEIQDVIASVSFKGGNGKPATSSEAKIVQDADRLDAIGAIGIARAFAYGGAKGRKLYDWNEKARTEMTEQEYREAQPSSVTHFYEKLLLLKDQMTTETGKQMAEERHEFMLSFLKQLQTETDGNK
ncbi:HD domain protein [Planococcus halocryophilus Or1]|uniref:Phosphohydrolase n=1 Tax=Planococcus halocryophilus TaxID=1215089 RepID=A0A1C7DPU2_9BACL|nr:HD domain-containing protein [Planococcus halocryophilus]ANU13233.1 phosphohydrolase [Planococcus halocryophilus]EMF45247.1 HD domain protein [Planococcus halocryophilus Or1]